MERREKAGVQIGTDLKLEILKYTKVILHRCTYRMAF